MARDKQFKVRAICFRILLFATMMAILPYAAVSPSQMYKNTAECVLVGIAGYSMAVQVFVTIVGFTSCFPYNIWFVIALDSLNTVGWIAAVALLSFWDLHVLYKPHKSDPANWLECANTPYWKSVLTDDGWGKWLQLVWCEVEVDGQDRLIGNSAARVQHKVLTGLATVALTFDALIILWTAVRGKRHYLIERRKRNPVAYSSVPDAAQSEGE